MMVGANNKNPHKAAAGAGKWQLWWWPEQNITESKKGGIKLN
jgi:hypothetical protein